jgi:site-specific recombinase XerD
MDETKECSRDLATMVVPPAGRLVATSDEWEPYQLLDPDGVAVEAVAAFLRDLQAAGRSPATLRSYGMDLLRWFRFLWAAGVAWERATRAEARDFCRWLQIAGKPARPHWRSQGEMPTRTRPATPPASTGEAYAASVRAHSETVLRCFYDFHRDAGSGPILNPFPLERSRRGRRAHAHHNPMEPYRNQRSGLYRPTVPTRIPRSIPDEQFNELFARLPSHRDRALVAFYVSAGARASELLSATQGGVDPGRQLITVVRKGSRQLQELPASTDAFVWLRLYQLELEDAMPRGRRQPLWWTLRRPHRPLTYHAAHRMFERVNQQAGTDVTLHALRHTAAYRMAEDPALPLTDVQFVLGHAQLSTTQLYLTPRKEEVVRRLLAHHAEQTRQARQRVAPVAAVGYRPETLDTLFERSLGTGSGARWGTGVVGR